MARRKTDQLRRATELQRSCQSPDESAGMDTKRARELADCQKGLMGLTLALSVFALQLGVHKLPPERSPRVGDHFLRVRVQQFEKIDEPATKGFWDEDPWSRSRCLRSLIEDQMVVQSELVLLTDKRIKLFFYSPTLHLH